MMLTDRSTETANDTAREIEGREKADDSLVMSGPDASDIRHILAGENLTGFRPSVWLQPNWNTALVEIPLGLLD